MQQKKVFFIGIIVVVTFLGLIYGVYFLKGKRLLSKDLILYARYEKINGLYGSDAIQINGYQVGQVTDIYFAEDNSGDLIVEMLIQADIDIPKNSIAKISAFDIMGTMGVNIILGDDHANFASTGDSLTPALETSMKDEIEIHVLPIKEKAEKLISSLDSVVNVVQVVFDDEMQQNIKTSFSGVNGTISNLQRTTYKLDTLINNQSGKISHVISNFSSVSDTLAAIELNKTIADANKAISDINEVITKINEGEGTINQLLTNDTLYTNIENATKKLDILFEDIEENPKKYVHFSIFGRKDKKDKKTKE